MKEHDNRFIKIKQRAKEVEWDLYFKEHGKGVSMYKTKDLVKMVLVGIPESLKSNLWLTFSGKRYLLIFELKFILLYLMIICLILNFENNLEYYFINLYLLRF